MEAVLEAPSPLRANFAYPPPAALLGQVSARKERKEQSTPAPQWCVKLCTKCGLHPVNSRKTVAKGLCCNRCPNHGPWCTMHMEKGLENPEKAAASSAKKPAQRAKNEKNSSVSAIPAPSVKTMEAQDCDGTERRGGKPKQKKKLDFDDAIGKTPQRATQTPQRVREMMDEVTPCASMVEPSGNGSMLSMTPDAYKDVELESAGVSAHTPTAAGMIAQGTAAEDGADEVQDPCSEHFEVEDFVWSELRQMETAVDAALYDGEEEAALSMGLGLSIDDKGLIASSSNQKSSMVHAVQKPRQEEQVLEQPQAKTPFVDRVAGVVTHGMAFVGDKIQSLSDTMASIRKRRPRANEKKPRRKSTTSTKFEAMIEEELFGGSNRKERRKSAAADELMASIREEQGKTRRRKSKVDEEFEAFFADSPSVGSGRKARRNSSAAAVFQGSPGEELLRSCSKKDRRKSIQAAESASSSWQHPGASGKKNRRKSAVAADFEPSSCDRLGASGMTNRRKSMGVAESETSFAEHPGSDEAAEAWSIFKELKEKERQDRRKSWVKNALAAKASNQVADATEFQVGDAVVVRDKGHCDEWKSARVTSVEPLLVKVDGWSWSTSWDEVCPKAATESEEMNEEHADAQLESDPYGSLDDETWNLGDIAKLYGRVGKITQGPDSFDRVRLEYTDGTQSTYVGVAELERGTASEWHEDEVAQLCTEVFEAEEVKQAEAEVEAVEASIMRERKLAERRIRKSLACLGEVVDEESEEEFSTEQITETILRIRRDIAENNSRPHHAGRKQLDKPKRQGAQNAKRPRHAVTTTSRVRALSDDDTPKAPSERKAKPGRPAKTNPEKPCLSADLSPLASHDRSPWAAPATKRPRHGRTSSPKAHVAKERKGKRTRQATARTKKQIFSDDEDTEEECEARVASPVMTSPRQQTPVRSEVCTPQSAPGNAASSKDEAVVAEVAESSIPCGEMCWGTEASP